MNDVRTPAHAAAREPGYAGPADLARRVDEIDRKLDVILEEIELQRRHRREMEDLRDDLTRVGKDLYDSAVIELEEVHDHMETADAVHLLKKLLRNVNNINLTLERLENAQDFLQDFTPVSRELFIDTMNRLDELDRKGYFEFIAELARVGDTVVTSFSPEDVRRLGENIVTILQTVKSLSQEDVLRTVNNGLSVYRQLSIDVPEKVSTWQLLRELNTPEMRRGMAYLIRFQKSLVALEAENQTHGE
jgi:uncharacterized protein YjgD (DUF1641 family)